MSIFGHTKDVANVVIGWAGAGTPLTWLQAAGHGRSSLIDYAHNVPGTAVPSHANPATELSCYELFLLALFENGWATQAQLQNIYHDTTLHNAAGLSATGLGAGLNTYTVGVSQAPNKGHLVFFNGLQHVTMATGATATHYGTPGSEIVTFWTDNLGNPPNGIGPVPNTPVLFDTIEGLHGRIAGVAPGNILVTYAKPRWR